MNCDTTRVDYHDDFPFYLTTPMGGGRAARQGRARAGTAPAAVLARSVSPPAARPTPIPVQASGRRAGTTQQRST